MFRHLQGSFKTGSVHTAALSEAELIVAWKHYINCPQPPPGFLLIASNINKQAIDEFESDIGLQLTTEKSRDDRPWRKALWWHC